MCACHSIICLDLIYAFLKIFNRHGVAKTDFNILRDKTLSFHLVLENSLRSLRGNPAPMTPFQGPARMDLMSMLFNNLKCFFFFFCEIKISWSFGGIGTFNK